MLSFYHLLFSISFSQNFLLLLHSTISLHFSLNVIFHSLIFFILLFNNFHFSFRFFFSVLHLIFFFIYYFIHFSFFQFSVFNFSFFIHFFSNSQIPRFFNFNRLINFSKTSILLLIS